MGAGLRPGFPGKGPGCPGDPPGARWREPSPAVGKAGTAAMFPLATADLYLNRIKYALCEGNTPLLSQTWGHPLSPKSCHGGLCGALCSEPGPSLSGQAPNHILVWLFLFLFSWRPGPYLRQGGSQMWRVPPCLSHARRLG